MSKLAKAVIAKLSSEGLSISSDWKLIEDCLSKVVSPSKCIEMAKILRKGIKC